MGPNAGSHFLIPSLKQEVFIEHQPCARPCSSGGEPERNLKGHWPPRTCNLEEETKEKGWSLLDITAAGEASSFPWEAASGHPQRMMTKLKNQTCHGCSSSSCLLSEIPITGWEILVVTYLPWRCRPPWSVIWTGMLNGCMRPRGWARWTPFTWVIASEGTRRVILKHQRERGPRGSHQCPTRAAIKSTTASKAATWCWVVPALLDRWEVRAGLPVALQIPNEAEQSVLEAQEAPA